MTLSKKSLINLVFLLSCFPFFKLIPGVDADVQPLCGLVALAVIGRYGVKRDAVTPLCLLLMLVILLYLPVAALSGVEMGPAAALAAAYLLPVLTFLALKDNLTLLSPRVFAAALAVWLVTGLLQQLGVFDPVIAALKLDTVIRGIKGAAWGGDRGVTFLAPEPSYAATIILQLLVTAAVLRAQGKITRNQCALAFVAVAAMTLFNRSGTGVLEEACFGGVFLLARLRRSPRHLQIRLTAVAAAAVALVSVLLLSVADAYGDQIRFLELIRIVAGTDLWHSNLETILSMLAGKRFLTVLVGYASLFTHGGLGYGVGSYQQQFPALAAFAGIDFSTIALLLPSERFAAVLKPDSYGSVLALDTGLPGLFVLLAFLVRCYTRPALGARLSPQGGSLRLGMFLVAGYLILFDSPTALPVAWILLAYVHSAFAETQPGAAVTEAPGPSPRRVFVRRLAPTGGPHAPRPAATASRTITLRTDSRTKVSRTKVSRTTASRMTHS